MYEKFFKYLAAVLAGITPLQSAMADDCRSASGDCVAVGKWSFGVSLGAGVRTNPLAGGNNIPLVVVPQFSYYGNRLFINDLDLGFTLAEGESNTLDLVASPGYDRVFFYRSDLQNVFVTGFSAVPGLATEEYQRVPSYTPNAVQIPPHARRITYLAGPEWTFQLHGISGQLDVLRDITGRDDGTEVRAALGIPLVRSSGALTVNVGITWKSEEIVNYYYGAADIYRGGSALNPFLKLGYTLPISGKWRLNAFAEYERLGNAIAKSPLVAENYVVTAFLGATYAF